jgi:hypothetical protein
MVPDEAALDVLSRRLSWAGVDHVRVVEPDAPWLGQLMAIGVPPGRKEVVGRPFSSLSKLR